VLSFLISPYNSSHVGFFVSTCFLAIFCVLQCCVVPWTKFRVSPVLGCVSRLCSVNFQLSYSASLRPDIRLDLHFVRAA